MRVPAARGWEVFLVILGGGGRAALDPISDQTSKIHTRFHTWPLGRIYVSITHIMEYFPPGGRLLLFMLSLTLIKKSLFRFSGVVGKT